MRLLHQAAKQQHAAACGEPKGFTATVIRETCSTDFAFTHSCNRQLRIMASVQQHRLQQNIFPYSIQIICPALQVHYILHMFCMCRQTNNSMSVADYQQIHLSVQAAGFFSVNICFLICFTVCIIFFLFNIIFFCVRLSVSNT